MEYTKALPEDYKRMKELKRQIEKIEDAYARECIELYNQQGFDEYSPKWQKKITKLAQKYADLVYPLKEEHNELCDLINYHEEEERKRKYVDPS